MLFCSSSSSTGTELNQRTPLGFFPSPSPSLVLLVIRKREEKNQGFVKRKSTERKRMQEEVKQGWGVAVVHMDFSPFFPPPPPHTLSTLSLSSFSFSLPPSLPCLALSPSLVFLALAGHAAAAQLFGSLGFMVAALPLPNDGLVNSDLHWCGDVSLSTVRPLHPTPSKILFFCLHD